MNPLTTSIKDQTEIYIVRLLKYLGIVAVLMMVFTIVGYYASDLPEERPQGVFTITQLNGNPFCTMVCRDGEIDTRYQVIDWMSTYREDIRVPIIIDTKTNKRYALIAASLYEVHRQEVK